MLSIVLLIFYFLMFQFQIMSDTIDFSSLVFNICGVQCKSNTSLRKHTKGVHDDRQFSCDICDMKIVGKAKMRTHMITHQVFSCNHCHKNISMPNKSTGCPKKNSLSPFWNLIFSVAVAT